MSLDVNELIEEALPWNGVSAKHRILVQAQPLRSCQRFEGIEFSSSMFINLITNAIDSMVAKTLRGPVRQSEAFERDGVKNPWRTLARYQSEHIERIFNPLFTTKERHGMGLSICRAIIEAHEGRLWVSPNVQGSVFQFTLRN